MHRAIRILLVAGAVAALSTTRAQPPPQPLQDPRFAPIIQQLIAAPDAAARANLYSANASLLTPDFAEALVKAGHSLGNGGNVAGAMHVYEIGCELSDRISYPRGKATCSYSTAMVLLRQGNFAEAEARFVKSVDGYAALSDHDYTARSLENIALIYRFRNDFPQALVYFDRAAKEVELANRPASLANNRLSVGHLYRAMTKYDLSAQAFQQGIDVAQANHLDTELGRLLIGMAGVHCQLNDAALCLSYGERALAMKDKLGDKLGPVQALEIVALASESLGKSDQARQYYEAGMKASDEAADPYIRLMMRFNFGNFLFTHGDIPAAIPMLEETIALSDKNNRPGMKAQAQTTLAEIANKQARWQDALQTGLPAFEFAKRTSDLLLIYRAGDAVGVAQAALGQTADAERSFRAALGSIEATRDQISADRDVVARFLQDKTGIYYHLVELLQRQGRNEDALAIAELSKARVVLDVLVRGNVDFSQSMTASDKAREATLLAKIAESRKAANPDKLDAAILDYRDFKSRLYASHPEIRLRRADILPATPSEMLAALPELDSALLQYVVSKSAVYLFVVTAEAGKPVTRSYALDVDRTALTRDVSKFRDLIGSRDLGFRQLGGSLYKALIAPASAQIRSKKTFVIVPDGFLWQVPFQALEPVAARYLIEDKAVFYAPSFTVLSEMLKTKRSAMQPKILAVGATGLASTRREALGLRDIYGAANTKVFLDADADLANLRKDVSTYSVLHLAAHGVFEDRDPLASYLILAKGSLDATAMMNLNLKAGMVVLSGCETGRGTVGNGEGLIGMSWALFVAGSPATVASQWKVDAASTSELMLQFHRGVRASNSKARAMQQASLAVMKMPQYRHPFYWSGFVVMGQGF